MTVNIITPEEAACSYCKLPSSPGEAFWYCPNNSCPACVGTNLAAIPLKEFE